MILTTEYDILAYNVQADVESLVLSSEDTITNTVTINRNHIIYNNNLISKQLLINNEILNTIIVS